MQIGIANIDITPEPGIELCGFANRKQPSDHVLDRLFCKGLLIDSNDQKILWLQLDLVGIDRAFAMKIRRWAANQFNIPVQNIILAATHTHSGPATIALNHCGMINDQYLLFLEKQIKICCAETFVNTEDCEVISAETKCDLGIDRRGYASAHTDPTVNVMIFKRPDGTLKAVLINYGMHPVCLWGTGISSDFPGKLCEMVSGKLPNNPLVIFGLRPCGNVNPPKAGVSYDQLKIWSNQIAVASLAVIHSMVNGPLNQSSDVQITSKTLDMEVDTMTIAEVDEYADRYKADISLSHEFGPNFMKALETWRHTMKEKIRLKNLPDTQIEITCLKVGENYILALNAELFSKFTELLKDGNQEKICVISCANGMAGYMPTDIAYDEGGYEVETCIFFFNTFRPKRGTLELLAKEARRMISSLKA